MRVGLSSLIYHQNNLFRILFEGRREGDRSKSSHLFQCCEQQRQCRQRQQPSPPRQVFVSRQGVGMFSGGDMLCIGIPWLRLLPPSQCCVLQRSWALLSAWLSLLGRCVDFHCFEQKWPGIKPISPIASLLAYKTPISILYLHCVESIS